MYVNGTNSHDDFSPPTSVFADDDGERMKNDCCSMDVVGDNSIERQGESRKLHMSSSDLILLYGT